MAGNAGYVITPDDHRVLDCITQSGGALIRRQIEDRTGMHNSVVNASLATLLRFGLTSQRKETSEEVSARRKAQHSHADMMGATQIYRSRLHEVTENGLAFHRGWQDLILLQIQPEMLSLSSVQTLLLQEADALDGKPLLHLSGVPIHDDSLREDVQSLLSARWITSARVGEGPLGIVVRYIMRPLIRPVASRLVSEAKPESRT